MKYRFLDTIEIPPKILPRFAGSLATIYVNERSKEIVLEHKAVTEFTDEEKENISKFLKKYVQERL